VTRFAGKALLIVHHGKRPTTMMWHHAIKPDERSTLLRADQAPADITIIRPEFVAELQAAPTIRRETKPQQSSSMV